MLYDLQCLGVDLRDLWRDDTDVSPRYVLMLVGHLEEGSAVVAEKRGGREFRPWTTSTMFLAATVNLLFAANRQRGGKRGGKMPISPPSKRRQKKVLTVSAILERQRRADSGA